MTKEDPRALTVWRNVLSLITGQPVPYQRQRTSVPMTKSRRDVVRELGIRRKPANRRLRRKFW